VEWNPPADRPPLIEALGWPRSAWFEPIVVTVPAEVHRKFEHAEALPLFQMIAKNVGIRRAHSAFVLATNIDILFSDELFAFFGQELEPNALYRVDRLDIAADLERKPLPSPAECRALPWLRAHRRDGTHYPDGRRPPWYARARTRLNRGIWEATHGGPLPALHTWACGDFTLTGRDVWAAMGGYPEWPMFSMFLDSIVMMQAYHAGVRMVDLPPPMVVYHLEHGKGSGWTPEGARPLSQRLDAAGIPYLTGATYDKLARSILSKGAGHHPFNGPDWGLSDVELPVLIPGSHDVAGKTDSGL
jgi:hypothetical protein